MFQLTIRSPDLPALIQAAVDTLQEGLQIAERILLTKYYRGPRIAVHIGPGTLIAVLSEEEVQIANIEGQIAKQKGGLVQPNRHSKPGENFVLHIQYKGAVGFPPLFYETAEERDEALSLALDDECIRYVVKEGHDYLFVQLGSGTLFFAFSAEEYDAQRREAASHAVRQQAGVPPSRIVVPGRS